LTWIHGRAHDVTEFEKVHPGGRVAMSMAIDRDATALFESYHPLSKRARATLKTLETTTTRPVPVKPEMPTLDWSNSKFMQEIRDILKEHKAKHRNEIGSGQFAHGRRMIFIAVMFCLNILTLRLMISGSWIGAVLFGFASWVFTANSFHDASHFALTSNWRVNRAMQYLGPYLSSPLTWDVHHVVAHHNLCNTEEDPDSRLFKVVRGRYRKTWWIKFVLAAVGVAIITDIRAWVLLFVHTSPMFPHATEKRRYFHFAGRVLWWIGSLAWPFMFTEWSVLKCIAFGVIPWLTFGGCFGLCSQLSHLQVDCEPPPTTGERDWYQLQCYTSTNYGNGAWFWFWFLFSGGLAMQIEHHLFPGVNHCQLPRLSARVKQVCAKHNIPYRWFDGVIEPLASHINYMATPEADPIVRKSA